MDSALDHPYLLFTVYHLDDALYEEGVKEVANGRCFFGDGVIVQDQLCSVDRVRSCFDWLAAWKDEADDGSGFVDQVMTAVLFELCGLLDGHEVLCSKPTTNSGNRIPTDPLLKPLA